MAVTADAAKLEAQRREAEGVRALHEARRTELQEAAERARRRAKLAKTGTGIAGSALTTAGSVILPIPVVGWIVGGLMVAVGGALSLASSKYDPARAASRETLLVQGASWAFSSAVARAQKWPEAKLREEIEKATRAWQRNASQANADQLAAYRFALQSRGYVEAVEVGVVEAQAQIGAAHERTLLQNKVVTGGAMLFVVALLALVFKGVRR